MGRTLMGSERADGSRRTRVAHVPRNIGGNTAGLSDALELLGFESEMISSVGDPFGFSANGVAPPGLVGELRRVLSIPRILLTHDVIHYNAGTTIAMPALPLSRTQIRRHPFRFLVTEAHSWLMELVQLLELTAARALRRTLVMTFQGDDARQGDVSLRHFEESIAHHVDDSYYNPRSDRAKRRRIVRYERFGVRMLALNPDLLHVLPVGSRFIPYTNVDVSEVIADDPTVDQRKEPRVLRIAHAPSHRAAKGTAQIIDAVESLQNDGFPIQLVLVENESNTVARQLIAHADVLIDQLYAGWYGGVAVEAMAAGVPVLSYIREGDLHFVPEAMVKDMPIIRTTSSRVRDSLLEFLALSGFERCQLSDSSRSYVRRWHNPRLIASQVADLYGENMHENTSRRRLGD